MKKIQIPLYVTLVAAILFSLFSIHFAADISLLAFPISALGVGCAVYFLFFKFFKSEEYKFYIPALKLLQYLPYILLLSFILRRAGEKGTYYWYDVVTVLLWCVSIVARWVLLYHFNEKRILKLFPQWEKERRKSNKGGSLIVKPAGAKRIGFEILDWIDALVQAVFMVLLIQIFIFQLYVIPSESMVPYFLVKDRVVVSKITSGPKFPLSDVGLPEIKKYRRGDIIVFRNPHYSLDRKSEVRTVVSQIVYMLTFTGVNLNTDENGEIKADPLVKRVCGIPGEQLVMQDGILYARTSQSDLFTPVELDKKYAAWNLNAVSPDIKRGIELIPLSQSHYDLMLEVEEMRRSLDISSVALECRSLSEAVRRLCANSAKDGGEENFSLYEYTVFANNMTMAEKIMSSKKCLDWFDSFMTSWINDRAQAQSDLQSDMYAAANYRLNVMIKLCAGRIIARNIELLRQGKSASDFENDSQLKEHFSLAEKLHFYVMLLDQRNMPVFPENGADGDPRYIPEGCYFMMGDNRFNSLDMRHSYSQWEAPLTKYDDYSVTYYSNMAPQYVNKKYILGSAFYRFWPLSRHGLIARGEK